jgi:hypothetical protein
MQQKSRKEFGTISEEFRNKFEECDSETLEIKRLSEIEFD